MNVGTLSGLRVCPFSGSGAVYGLLTVFHRRAYIFGATQRGIFYRIGANIFSPKEGYWDSTFALKTKIWEIDLMLKVGMKDEVFTCWFRPNWIHGTLHFSRTGCLTFLFRAADPKVSSKTKGENVEDFSTATLYGDAFYDSDNEERKQLDSY
jgi:hypothetical protein